MIFSDPGTSYTNTDAVTVNNYGPVNVSNCSSISMSVHYNFSLPFPGAGNMESNDECPFGGGCAGDPNNADAGGCANCWDFIYVQFQLDGVTVHTELVGVVGNLNQTGTLSYGPVCTNNATNASIIIWTQTWAANESITFSNITITCWDASAMVSANPDPVCSSSPFNLNGTLTNPGSVNTTVWSGPGTIANPNSLNTQVTNAPVGTNTYTLTITDDNNCTNTESVSVTVNQAPTLNDPPNITVCPGDPVDVAFSGTGSPLVSWTNNNAAIGLGTNGTGDISFTAANVANTTTGTITATPNENGCTGPSQSFSITVNPLPLVNQPNNVTVCAGAGVNVNFSGSAGATYSWTNDNPAIGLGASGNGNIGFTSANVSTQETGNITVTPTLNGCPGNPVNFSITVNPAPTVDDPPNQTVCAGDPVDVNFTSPGNPNFQWTNTNPAIGLSANGTGDISFTSANVAATTTGTITVTPNEGGCPGPSQSFTVTVNPVPTVNLPANVAVCAGAPVSVNFSGTAGATFSWTNDNPAIGLGASGNGNINFNTANVSTQETGNITITPVINGCPGDPQTFSITVNPGPSVSDPADQTVCAGDAVAVNFSGVGNPNFQWTNSNPAIGLAVNGTGDISFNAANVANTTTGTITVTPNAGGCPGPSQSFTITVNPVPNVNLPANVAVCAGAPVSVNFSGTAGATFSWTNDNPAIGLGASGNGNISFTAANVATQTIGNITVTPVINGCPGNPQTFSITINPGPTVSDPADQTVCAGNAVSVNFSSSGNPTFQWNNSNPAIGLAANGTGNISFTAANVAAITTGTITVTPSEAGCTGPAQTFTITVNPVPTANQPGDQTVCAGTPVNVALGGTAGATFNWSNDNVAIGLGASGSGNISFNAANVVSQQTGQITVTPVIGTCTGSSINFNITVNPAPSVNDPADQTVCAGNAVSANFSGTGNPTFQWTNSNPAIGLAANGTGNITFTAANVAATTTGTITVTPSEAGCTGPAQTFTITVNPVPTANQPGDQTVCAGTPVNVALGGTAGATFNWSNDNVAIGLGASGSGNISFNAANVASQQTGHITVTPVIGTCTGSTINFNITVNPAPSVNDPADQTVCAGNAVSANFSGTGNPTFQWTNSNPAIGLAANGTGNISFTAANVAAITTGTITVTPSEAGCTGPAQTFTITVNPVPTANQPGDQTVCAGTPVNVALGGTAGATFNWSNDNPAIGLGASGSGNISFNAANVATQQTGHITVTPVIGTCTGSTINFNITVNPAPSVNDVPDATVCSGQQLSIHLTGSNNPVIDWNNSNTAIGLGASGTGDINFTATGAGSGLVTLTPTENGCTGASQSFSITVIASPIVDATANTQVCAGNPVQILFSGTPTAVFSWNNNNTAIGLGASGSGNINFTAANTGAVTTGTISVTPSLNGCSGAAQTFDITVNPLPTISNLNVVCAPDLLTYSITLNTTGLSLSSTAGTVSGGGGAYTVSGIPAGVSVTLSSTDTGSGCQTQQTVNAPNCNCAPVSAPANPNSPVICDGAPIPALTVNVPSGFAVDWYAAPSGGAPLLAGSASYTPAGPLSAGVYHYYAEAREIATNCTSPTRIDVVLTINPLPQVNPQTDQTICAGALVNVNFSGSSSAAYKWSNSNTAIGLSASGSGNISFNALNSGNTPEIANLIVTPVLNGCSGASQAFNITVNPVPVLNAPGNQSACSGTSVSINFSGTSGSSFDWTNSDPSIGLAASGNGNISFTAANVSTPTLANIVVTPTLTGCSGLSQTFTIEIKPTPVLTAPADQSVCSGAPVSVSFTGNSGALFSWNNSNTGIGLGASGTGDIGFTAINAGNAPLTGNITVTPDLNGCIGAAQAFNITVNPLPSLAVDSTVCATDLNSYTVYLHSSGDQLNASSGTVSGLAPNYSVGGIPISSNVTLSAILNTGGCNQQQTVNAPNCSCPPVLAAGTPNDPSICDGLPIPALTVTALPGSTVDWFASPSGGSPLLSGSLSFSPLGPFSPGTYSFYAETRDINSNCISSTRTKVTLTVLPNPVLPNPGNQQVCVGSPVTVNFNAGTAATTWTNDQSGIGLNASGAGDISFTAINAGNNPLTANIQAGASQNGCISAPVNFQITVNPLPTLGIDSIVCSADQSNYTIYVNTTGNQLLSSVGTVSGSNPHFQIGNITQGTSAMLTVSNSSTTCSRQLNVNPPNCNCATVSPATTPGDQTVCEGQPIPALSAQADNGYTIDWYSTPSGGALLAMGTDIYTPSGPFLPGIYHFYAETREIATGCVSNTRLEVTLTVLPSPVLTATADQSVCEGAQVQVNFSGTSGATFNWTNSETGIGLGANGAGNIQFVSNNPGNSPLTAHLTVTAQLDGCYSPAQPFNLTVFPIPVAAISGNTMICSGFSTTLSATGGSGFSWSNGQNTSSINIQAQNSGSYTVTVTENGCSATASAFITVNQPSASTQNALTCDSSMIGITTSVIPNAAGCDSVITTITAFDAVACVPISTLLGGSINCFGALDGILTLNISNGLAPFQYKWSNGVQSGTGALNGASNSIQIPNLPSGNYSITVTGANGVTSTAVAVISTPPLLNAAVDVQLQYGIYALSCAGASDASLSGLASGGTPPFQYAWSVAGQNSSDLDGVGAGSYILTVTDAHLCTATSAATVIEPPALGLEVSLLETACGAIAVPTQILTANGLEPLTLEIDGTAVDNYSPALSEGEHHIALSDANGCVADTLMTVVLPESPEISLPADTTVLFGETLVLEAQTNLNNWQSLVWNPAAPDSTCLHCLRQEWMPERSGQFQVVITDNKGCSASASVRVQVSRKVHLYIPNVFSPNDDGDNDFWNLFAGPSVLKINTLHIFDRWGDEVFRLDESVLIKDWKGWDGNFRGQPLNPAVFVYYLEVELIDGEKLLRSGDVTIVR